MEFYDIDAPWCYRERKKRKLNLKREKLCHKIVEGVNKVDLVKEIYPSSNHPESSADNLLNIKCIKNRFTELANQIGFTGEIILEKAKEKLNAKKALVLNNKINYVDDNQAQLKAVEIGLKVHGIEDNEKSNNINVNVLNSGNYNDFMKAYYEAKNNQSNV